MQHVSQHFSSLDSHYDVEEHGQSGRLICRNVLVHPNDDRLESFARWLSDECRRHANQSSRHQLQHILTMVGSHLQIRVSYRSQTNVSVAEGWHRVSLLILAVTACDVCPEHTLETKLAAVHEFL
jgi:hypothetical protein